MLNASKLKEFADDNLIIDENDGKFSIMVENIGCKRKITHYDQFLLYLQNFQNMCTAYT